MNVHRALLSAVLLFVAAGCNSGHGPDSLFSRQTQSSQQITDCMRCHISSNSPSLDPLISNGSGTRGKHAKHVGERKIACERCHNGYITTTTHMNGILNTSDPAVNIVSFNITGPSGAWVNDTGAGTGSCAGVACHGTATLDWYGTNTWTTPSSCTDCHSSTFSSVLDPLLTNGSGVSGKHTKHVGSIGFACAKCHLDYPSRISHASGILDTQDPSVMLVYFDGANPSGAWTADTGQETGTCSTTSCHAGESPAWYGTAGVATPPCVTCHVNAMGTRRAVMGANGDFGKNSAIKSHHVTGASGTTIDPVTDQCLVCHEMSVHMGGTVRLRNADTNATIAYDPAIASTLEPFCLSCHDTSGALLTLRSGSTSTTPFIDGSIMGKMPYRASIDIYSSWAKSHGHKQKGLTCIGNGAPDTGCHGNGHGTANVGLLARGYEIPQPDRYRETDFAICLDCHQSYPNVTKEVIFGVKFTGAYDQGYGPKQSPLLRSNPTLSRNPPYDLPGGIRTHFRDQNGPTTAKPYDDWDMFGAFLNLHWMHISSGPSWSYRGIMNTGISCTACHSVHGSNTKAGAVYDEMQYTLYSAGSDSYGTMLGDLNNLQQYPTYCSFNCHGSFYSWGMPTYNWYEPANE